MKVAYLYDRPASVGKELGADKVFADTPETRRVDRASMIDAGGIRAGDTLVLCSENDLGSRRTEVDGMLARIKTLGVSVEVAGIDRKKVATPKGHRKPDAEKLGRMCVLWRSSLDARHVLDRATDIAGFAVTRNNMNQWCGPRHKRKN